MPEPLVFLNGRMIPASQAHLAISDAGFVQGATVTEMTRTFHKQLWRLGDHLDRLFRSLKYTRMDIGMTREQLASISRELAEHNARLLDDNGELGLIHFVTPGEYPTYAGSSGQAPRTTPTLCAHSLPVAVPPLGAKNDRPEHTWSRPRSARCRRNVAIPKSNTAVGCTTISPTTRPASSIPRRRRCCSTSMAT